MCDCVSVLRGVAGVDRGEQRAVSGAERQPPPAAVRREAREDHPLHDQGEGAHARQPRLHLGGTGSHK